MRWTTHWGRPRCFASDLRSEREWVSQFLLRRTVETRVRGRGPRTGAERRAQDERSIFCWREDRTGAREEAGGEGTCPGPLGQGLLSACRSGTRPDGTPPSQLDHLLALPLLALSPPMLISPAYAPLLLLISPSSDLFGASLFYIFQIHKLKLALGFLLEQVQGLRQQKQ